jgi:hypothetical protein
MFQHTIGQVCADSWVSNNKSHAALNKMIKLITKVSPLNMTASSSEQVAEHVAVSNISVTTGENIGPVEICFK